MYPKFKSKAPIYAGLLSLVTKLGRADPTWPAPTDQMEEIVFQLQGVGGSLFNDIITPCNNEAAGPGRVTAAEWLRTGFHDMASFNRFQGTGGLDGSLQFELTRSDNTGPGFKTTLEFYANYVSARSSLADLIAAGVYASVRSCGGPAVPLRMGRVDASRAVSPSGLTPQPQNSAQAFERSFDNMGFSRTEMIQLVACGHTLGSVHSTEFPNIVPAATGQIPFDTTAAGFDNKIAVEYVAKNTTNPLAVGAAVAIDRHADFKVFNRDGNVTINTLTDPVVFRDTCQTVLAKMINAVPSSVTLTAPIAPYTVKPQDMQLTLNNVGDAFLLTGRIRVRTTEVPGSTITNVVLTWKDRSGGNSCGSLSHCSTTATMQGVATGFDDTFAMFPIEATIPISAGISSFTVTINRNDGSSELYDNNGNSYPLSDAVILQKTQSCLLQTSGQLTAVALVRNDLGDVPVDLEVSYLVPRADTNNPVPSVNTATVGMIKGDCVGPYTFYTASYTIAGGQSYNARLTINAGGFTDDFNKASILGGTCNTFTGTPACTNVTAPTSSSSVISSSTSTSISSSSTVVSSTSSSASSSSVVSTTSSSTTSTSTGVPSPTAKSPVGGYVFVNCRTEGTGVRALGGAAFADDNMTLELCASNCAGWDQWGVEYGQECYCGNSVHSSSSEAPLTDCNMVCAGDASEYCGAGNRLNVYSTTATRSTSATPTPTGTLGRKATVGPYEYVGCQTEATVGRALSGSGYASNDMTLESCAAFCSGFTYFGTEYSAECFCGNSLNAGSVPAPESDCNMVCAGNPLEYCGAGNRLELYRLPGGSSSSSSSATSGTSTQATVTTTSTSTSTSSPTGTLQHQPTVSPYTLAGCYTEGVGSRALTGKGTASASMTLESCATFCDGFKYFGTEYSSECFCGNTIHSTSLNVSLSECSMTCSGNPLQYCGAGNRLSLYERDLASETPSGPTHPDTVTTGSTNWEFYKCMTEANPGLRALSNEQWADDEMTLEKCAGFCEGYTYFGAEYGRECYCGNAFGMGSVEAVVDECGMTCSGNGSEFCGAGNRLSVYRVLVV
ncbi:putative fungistatic metabolite [Podospora fimiseda]|uniref:Fungistatic metabolite n=1 Tax=Podospora fimiseda TaxID=252190 RepID=A0AAN7BRG5_9PEZI|nr:putative fungistatic metabolite [Podospora fimiseda]